MQVYRLFSVPFLHFKLSTHGNYVFNYPESGQLVNNKPTSWVGALHTTFPYAEGDDFISKEQVESLKADIFNEIQVAFLHLNLSCKFWIDEFWYNIYDKGFGQELHDHLSDTPADDPLWSGVYYHKNCNVVPTVFSRSGSEYRSQVFDGCENSEISDCFRQRWNPEVSDGDIVLFPPYLLHYVHCDFEDSAERVTFSFNVKRSSVDSQTGGTQPPETLS